MDSEQVLQRASDLAVAYLASLPERHVGARASREEMLAMLGGDLPDDGAEPVAVIDMLAATADRGTSAIAGPRYFGFVIGGALPTAVAADWLTSAWDQNAGIFAISPSASVAEEVAGAWLKELLGLPPGASFGFTTGCQMAHVTCLAAARHEVLGRAGWDVEGRGLIGAPPITILAGDEAHATIFAALQYLGLGHDTAIRVASDDQGRITTAALAAAVPADSPLIVCLQAGNVNSGSFDPLDDAIATIREQRPDAWIHVDGAFGLWAAASPATRHLVAGVELADSWATDGHKWLNVPYDAGYAFVAHPEAHRAALAPPSAAYVPESAGERDQSWWVTEYSRRARGYATWAALRSLGRRGVAELVERCCERARDFAARLGAVPGVEVLNEVVLNQVLVRFGDDDAMTRAVVERVQADGTLWLSGTTWHGKAAMRISVSNWSTSQADVDRSAEAIAAAVRSVRGAASAASPDATVELPAT